ncbi:MAG: leucyl aminopeptidase family protein [Alphaproteobacteria bacterium]|nr:leucyl aminopeptidase family protein [Alphaproteobacteria bacterium]
MIDPEKIVLAASPKQKPVPITVVNPAEWEKLSLKFGPHERNWAAAHGFAAGAGKFLVLPGADGKIAGILAGGGDKVEANPFSLGRLARLLPAGTYALDGAVGNPRLAALGWCLESYAFETYRKAGLPAACLVCPEGVDRTGLIRHARATFLARDLINTPSSDMGPDELEKAARAVATRFGAKLLVTKGKPLERGFPMIHHVGKASPRAPRLIEFTWGKARAPKVTLVGKGVCFDTGGLDIKPASGMLLMKKDMGGAANVLALSQMIMDANLPVRLRVLIPAVENAIAGNAFRPGDVLRSRKGLAVEIGNTDAEGRLVLGDALALADEEAPDLIVDMATLTGAARIALGPDLPPFYTEDSALAMALAAAAEVENDPLWRLPLWRPYDRLYESGIADFNNSGDSGFAGSIVAALFLRRFVERARSYVHLDIFGWTPAARPGCPRGGEAQGIRALFSLIEQRYS